ncbi:MAG: hydrogenase maturation nickel metallochaperone HypA [bacterium]
MHELHLVEDVIAKIKTVAEEQGLAKVSFARIKIGASLITHPPEFEELFKKFSGGIELKYVVVPLQAACASCSKEFDSSMPRLNCPHCSSTDIKITAGQELLVEELK